MKKEGNSYETQYCIVLNSKEDKGIKHYFWASKEQIKKAFRNLKSEYDPLDEEEKFFEGKFLKGKDFKARFGPSRLGSLSIETDNLEKGKSIFSLLSEDSKTKN